MRKAPAMKQAIRLVGFLLAWMLILPSAHAAWTATTLTGIQTTPAGDNPRGLAVLPAARLAVVANQDAATVSLVNLDTGNTSATIPVAAKPREVVIDAANARAYVLHEADSVSNTATISVIDLATQTRTAQWTLPGEFKQLLLNNPGTELLLAKEEGKQLLRVSTTDGTVLQTIALTYEPKALALTADGATLLLGTETGGVRLISTATWLETNSIATKEIKSLAWWPGGALAVAVTDDRNLTLLDLNTQTVAATVAFGGEPGALVPSPDRSRLILSEPFAGAFPFGCARPRKADRCDHASALPRAGPGAPPAGDGRQRHRDPTQGLSALPHAPRCVMTKALKPGDERG